MQGIRQAVFDLARSGLPVARILEPVLPIGNKGPRANVGQTIGERIDVAIDAIREGDLLGKPVFVDMSRGTLEVLNTLATNSAWFCEEILR